MNAPNLHRPGLQLIWISSLRLPCFRITDAAIVLPALSAFTGLDTQRVSPCTSYAFDEKGIYKIDPSFVMNDHK